MEKGLKFNSQVCTNLKQSKKLLELGLKPETADMVLLYEEYESHWRRQPYIWESYNEIDMDNFIPAWSLHRLLCLYGQDYTIKEVYNDAEECYGMLISAIEIAIENDEFNEKYLDR